MRTFSFILALFFFACQNQTKAPSADSSTPEQPMLGDTTTAGGLVGFRGADPAQMHEVSETIVEYYLDRYTIRVESNDESVGDQIQVSPKDGEPFAVNMPEDGYFAGVSGDYLLVDAGTGPDIRGLVVVDLRSKQNVLETTYVNEVTVENGVIQFFTPVERASLTALPNCPEQKEWEANGLLVGYAYRSDFSLETKQTTPHKDEVICFPLQ